MNSDLILAVIVVVLGASGLFLMLPHQHGAAKPRTTHAIGAASAALALLLFGWLWSAPGPWVSSLFFYVCAFAAVAGGALTVTSRDPLHSALWFASVVLSTSGLFLLAGASFLAAGSVIVYAGAIIVTFLFVIMLAQMEGRALYDRAARMPFRSTWTCFLLLLGLIWSILLVRTPPPPASPLASRNVTLSPRDNSTTPEVREVLWRSVRQSARLVDDQGRMKPHVAGLGETLYTDHLVTVELAGGLLFIALVSAVAIVTPKSPIRPGETRTTTPVS